MLFKNYKELINNGENNQIKKQRKDILDILDSAIKEVDPYKLVKNIFKEEKIFIERKTIDTKKFDNIYLISFGKASIKMAKAVLDSLNISETILITNDIKHEINDRNTKIYVGNHPIPNQNCINGTQHILKIIKECKKQDLLIFLISGGGSSLLCQPRIGLEDLKETTRLLLKTNMEISEINTIRKHLSFVKGGQLLNNVNCKAISLIISDIVNDPIEFIASGPTYPDSTTFNDAKKILIKHKIWDKIPKIARKTINDGLLRLISETPKKWDPKFYNIDNYIIGNNRDLCQAIEKYAKKNGYKTKIISTSVTGEAKNIGEKLIENIFEDYKNNSNKTKKLYISAGETIVNVVGSGKGGRNQEMVLGALTYFEDNDIVFASFATDGIDGFTEAAGAIADRYTLNRSLKKKIDPNYFLKNNNSYEFFKALDDLIITGPTGTNLMDIQIIIC
jgi:hydroxypyruvate reductase/glycerate 2-kinase